MEARVDRGSNDVNLGELRLTAEKMVILRTRGFRFGWVTSDDT